MKYATPRLNIDNAHAEYIIGGNGTTFFNQKLGFSNYSPSYVLTKEEIRWVSELKKKDGPRVLTVAASGDHPMFYAMRGATKIDTFDLSFCAKAAMDIKTAALKKLSRAEYIQLLSDMHTAHRASDIKQIGTLIDDIPQNSAYFIKQMAAYPIFSNGLYPSYYAHLVTPAYAHSLMRYQIHEPSYLL